MPDKDDPTVVGLYGVDAYGDESDDEYDDEYDDYDDEQDDMYGPEDFYSD